MHNKQEIEEIVKRNIDMTVKKIFRQIELKDKINYQNKKSFKQKKPKKNKVYPRDWSLYEKSKGNEKIMFLRLLKEAVNYMCIGYEWNGRGRPPFYYGDMLKCICIKAFHNLSTWRVPSEFKIAKSMGIIDFIPKRSTLSKYMSDEKITLMLHNLYKVLAEPMVMIEKYFAIDASGFSRKYGNTRWMIIRHTSEEKKRIKEYSKLNMFCGTKTKIVSAVQITEGTRHESPSFEPLLKTTTKLFDVDEVYADAAYLSKKNINACARLGITPYIWGKKNVHVSKKGKATPWNSMLREWKYQPEFFKERYHQRSLSETTFSMIKRKFGDFVRSKHEISIRNEILAKIVCHNATVLADAILHYNLKKGFIAKK